MHCHLLSTMLMMVLPESIFVLLSSTKYNYLYMIHNYIHGPRK